MELADAVTADASLPPPPMDRTDEDRVEPGPEELAMWAALDGENIGASLPAADVQRPTPPLTDEELAMFGHHRAGSSGRWCATCAHKWPCLSARLIADLRALRKCAEWARWHIAEEWPNGPTGSLPDWERFLSIVGKPESGPPPTLT